MRPRPLRVRRSARGAAVAASALVASIAGGAWAIALATRQMGAALHPGSPAPAHGAAARAHGAAARARGGQKHPFAVGERMLTLVERARRATLEGRPSGPRTLVTLVLYPALGASRSAVTPDAPPARAAGPFPLVVFGHGFDTTPATYSRLLTAWARAGFVVAAPTFPLTSADTPGGPRESDLVNQPGDMSFVITRMTELGRQAKGALSGMIDPRRIAVAGQSDGGETALAVAYDRHYLDRRVRAAVLLSGARIPTVAALRLGPGEPALLAAQGTADTVAPPRYTYAFFALARRPKFLLRLLGAGHLDPYTRAGPQLAIVQRVSTAFLALYLDRQASALALMEREGDHPGEAQLIAAP